MIYIQKEQELYHHGVKGMKWGVRKQNRDGSLTESGYSKYYTNGRLNSKGRKARRQAEHVKTFGNKSTAGRVLGYGLSAYSTKWSYTGASAISLFLHAKGNVTITKMRMEGASYNKRKAVAAAYIASMAAVKVASVLPLAKATYKDVRYQYSDSYRAKTDALAKLKDTERGQRNSGNKKRKK